MSAIVQPSRLREWRVSHDLSLGDMSDLTGYDKAYLSRVERGQAAMSALAKARLARRLGVRIRDLFEVEEISA